jgi:hypothetical protein
VVLPGESRAGSAFLVLHFLSTEGWSGWLEVWVTAWVASVKTAARYQTCLG